MQNTIVHQKGQPPSYAPEQSKTLRLDHSRVGLDVHADSTGVLIRSALAQAARHGALGVCAVGKALCEVSHRACWSMKRGGFAQISIESLQRAGATLLCRCAAQTR